MRVQIRDVVPTDTIQLGDDIFTISEMNFFEDKGMTLVSLGCTDGSGLVFKPDREVECIVHTPKEVSEEPLDIDDLLN